MDYFRGLTPSQKWHIPSDTGEPSIFQPSRREGRDSRTGERAVVGVQLPCLCRVR